MLFRDDEFKETLEECRKITKDLMAKYNENSARATLILYF
jgi:hypothetical protein